MIKISVGGYKCQPEQCSRCCYPQIVFPMFRGVENE